jgi:hypothetical protein
VTATLELLQDGKPHAISQAEYEYFFDVLPPVCGATQYQGQRWDYGFAEGADHVFLFRRQGEKCFAVKTPYLNPYEAGGFEMQTRRRILKWIELAKRNVAFRQAGSPRIDTQTFHEYASDQDLLAEAQLNGWRGGQALFVGNLCFVKLDQEGEEWLAINDHTVLGKTSFDRLIYAGGVEAAQAYLDAVRAAPPGESPTIGRTRRQR